MNRSTPRGSHRTRWLIFVAALTAGLGLHCGGAAEQEVAVEPEGPTSRSTPARAVEQPESTSDPRATSAFKMAVAEKGADVAVDDPIVQRFAVALGSLESKFEENRQQIAEITMAGFSRLREESGISDSQIDFLEVIDQVPPKGSGGPTFAQYVDTHVDLKIKTARGDSPVKGLVRRPKAVRRTPNR